MTKYASMLLLTNSEMILLLCCSGLICALLPIFLGWNYNYGYYNSSSAIVNQSLNSREFGYSIVACISVLVPLLIELFCDIISFSWKLIDRNKIFLGILIYCQLIPGLLILLVAIPKTSPLILVIAFQARNIAGICVAFSRISETGSPVFQAKSIFILTITAIISCLCSLYSPFLANSTTLNTVKKINIVSSIVCVSCFGYQTIRWIYRIRSKDYKDITTDELECTLHLLVIFLISCGFMILNFYFGSNLGPSTSISYLTIYNYLVATFSLSFIIIQGRIVHKEKDMAQQYLETKRLFVRYISHEIRTPLNTVFLGLKLLKEEIRHSDNTAMETLDDIQQSCDIALNILNDLLSYEKIESGLMVLENEELQPKEWLAEAVDPLYVQARKLDIELKLKYDSQFEGIILLADKPKISQVIRNVISNALKFTPPHGSVTVTASAITKKSIRFAEDYEIVNYLRVQIVDTGHGIEKDNIGKLFHQIIQFNASQLQAGGGSGLGLWISRAIVDKHRGSITAYSEGLGQGCTFTIDLPITDSPSLLPPLNTDTENQSIRRHTPMKSSRSRSRLLSFFSMDPQVFPLDRRNSGAATAVAPAVPWPIHVLVVDDCSLNRKMLVRLTERRFLTVREAVDGVDAVRQMTESLLPGGTAVDVIMMDYMMPRMDGPTAAKEIRHLGYSGLIIGVTGNALQVDIDAFISHGADKVITKPVDVDALIAVVSGRFNFQL